MKDKIIYKQISFPHIRVNVKFYDMKHVVTQGFETKGAGFTTLMDTEEDATLNIAVFFADIENSVRNIKDIPFLAHELVHVLQIICEERVMTFHDEAEHMAYLMSYMLEELCNQ